MKHPSAFFKTTVLFVFGAIYGSALDALHTHAGTFAYRQEAFFKMAWWTPLVFGIAGVVLGSEHLLFKRMTGEWPSRRLSSVRLLLALTAFTGIYGLSAWLPTSPWTTAVVLAAADVAMFVSFANTRAAFGLAIVSAVGGPGIEAVFVSLGLLTHRHTDLMGIPVWLPVLYFSGALVYASVGRWLFSPIEAPQ